jgi:hypothetical protein
MNKEKTQSDFNLDFMELDVLIYTIRHKEVAKIFIKEAELFGHEEKDGKAMFRDIQRKLKYQFIYK